VALKILLADDSMTAQNMGKKILTDAGFDVVAVSNGAAAMKKVTAEKPDIVILDVYMPGYTGLEVCERIKNSVETSSTPVLLTVGKMEPFRPEEANRVRADGVMIKPFEATDLTAAVRTILEKFHGGALPAELTVSAPSPSKSNGHSEKVQIPAVLREYEDTIRLTPEELKEIAIQDAHYEEWKSSTAAESAEYPIDLPPATAGASLPGSAAMESRSLAAETAAPAAVAEPATPLHEDELGGLAAATEPSAAPDYGWTAGMKRFPASSSLPSREMETPLAEVPAFGVEFADAPVASAPPAPVAEVETATPAPAPAMGSVEFELEASAPAAPAEPVGMPPLPELEFTAAPAETGEVQTATAPELELSLAGEPSASVVASDPGLVTNTDQDISQFAVKVGQEHFEEEAPQETGSAWQEESSQPVASEEMSSEIEPAGLQAASEAPMASLPELAEIEPPAAEESVASSYAESQPHEPAAPASSFGALGFGDILKPQADREEDTQSYEPVLDIPAPQAMESVAAPEQAAAEPAPPTREEAQGSSAVAAGMMWEVGGSSSIGFEQGAERAEEEKADEVEAPANTAAENARIHELIEVEESAEHISASGINLPPASEWFAATQPVEESRTSDLDAFRGEAFGQAATGQQLVGALEEHEAEKPAAEPTVEAPASVFAPLAEATAAAASNLTEAPSGDQIERAVSRALERLKGQLISEISRELGSK